MEEIVNLVGSDSSASDISDRIKDVLYAKAAERINTIRPTVGASMFDDQQDNSEGEEIMARTLCKGAWKADICHNN